MCPAKFDSYVFGCRVNHAEMIAIESKLLQDGFEKTSKHPDYVIINSCAVTHKAEREVRQLIYRLLKSDPKPKIVLTGCAATYWNEKKLWQDVKVDFLVTNKDKKNIPDLLKKYIVKKQSSIDKKSYDSQNKFTTSGRYILKIQDGCHRFCTYCIVAYLRGKPYSIPIEHLVTHIGHIEKNHKEVILTAINTEDYGKDTGEDLVDLLSEIAKKNSIQRISFGSIHPWSLTRKFINFYKNRADQRFVNFFHVPIQSGSERILRLMKRDYDVTKINQSLSEIRKKRNKSFFSTDIIVGFLDESDAEFDQTYNFLAKSIFSKFHIFRFSPRRDTAAFYMKKQYRLTDSKKAKERAASLKELSENKYEKFQKSLLGFNSQALIISKDNSYSTAILNNQIPVKIKTAKNMVGQMANVKAEEYKKGNLFGKILVTRA